MTSQFEIDGVGYMKDQFGVIHQEPPEVTQVYDRAYVEKRYDALPDHGRAMSMLRIGWIVGTLRLFRTVLDVGYGNGDFLAALGLWPSWRVERWGLDISGYPLPEGCAAATTLELAAKPWDLATFFDSLEHMPDIGFLETMRARHICITVPWCHEEQRSVKWFKTWKHRRPGEHLHHFSPASLISYMRSCGYEYLAHQALEDSIRKPANGDENTFTMMLRRVGRV